MISTQPRLTASNRVTASAAGISLVERDEIRAVGQHHARFQLARVVARVRENFAIVIRSDFIPVAEEQMNVGLCVQLARATTSDHCRRGR